MSLTSQDREQKVRFLLMSDTHCAIPAHAQSDKVFRWPLPKADVLIHAGDLTMNGTHEQHQKALELIDGVDAELKIVIPGNHDLTLHREYYEEFWNLHGPAKKYTPEQLDQIEDLYTSAQAKQRGIIYLTEGVETFDLSNGARFRLYASAWQPEFYQWAFGYPREEDRFNASASDATWRPPNPVPDGQIDIMVTHGPPANILDQTYKGENVGCEHLRRAVERCKPRLHVFGHIHEGWGAVTKNWARPSHSEQEIHETQDAILFDNMGALFDGTGLQNGRETLFVNASIMNLRYRPMQSPWIVDLMLPTSLQDNEARVD